MKNFGALMMVALLTIGCGSIGGDTPPPPKKNWTTEVKLLRSGASARIDWIDRSALTCVFVNGLGFKGDVSQTRGYFEINGADAAVRGIGFNTVVLDLIASSHRTTDGNKVTLDVIDGDLVKSLGELKEAFSRIVLVGHSIGGRAMAHAYSLSPSQYSGLAVLGWHPYAAEPAIPDPVMMGLKTVADGSNGWTNYTKVQVAANVDALTAFMFYPGTDQDDVNRGHLVADDVPWGAFNQALAELVDPNSRNPDWTPSGDRIYLQLYGADAIYNNPRTQWNVTTEKFPGGHANEIETEHRDDARSGLIAWLKKINDTQS